MNKEVMMKMEHNVSFSQPQRSDIDPLGLNWGLVSAIFFSKTGLFGR
jgi:hypothetical protein